MAIRFSRSRSSSNESPSIPLHPSQWGLETVVGEICPNHLMGTRDVQGNVSLLGRLTWQLLWHDLELDPGSCLQLEGPQPHCHHTQIQTHRHTHSESQLLWRWFLTLKISAISASVKNHSSHISPEHEAVVVMDPESFYHIIAIRSCKIRISTFHRAFLKSENRQASWVETVLRPGAQERSVKSEEGLQFSPNSGHLISLSLSFLMKENETTTWWKGFIYLHNIRVKNLVLKNLINCLRIFSLGELWT